MCCTIKTLVLGRLNGAVGVVVAPHGRLLLALTIRVHDGRVAAYDVIADPARLQQLDLAVLDGGGA